MKFSKTIIFGMLAWFLYANEATATTPVLPPSPDPCCVDGICYPKRATWGHYKSRWRRWPGDELDTMPSRAQPTPAADGEADLQPFETPAPEDEDRLAPPPIKKEDSASGVPGSDGGPAEPLGVPGAGLPSTRDLDPPPAMPFGTPQFTAPSEAIPTQQRVLQPAHQLHLRWQPKPMSPQHQMATNDPPPAMPLVLQGGGLQPQKPFFDPRVMPASAIMPRR